MICLKVQFGYEQYPVSLNLKQYSGGTFFPASNEKNEIKIKFEPILNGKTLNLTFRNAQIRNFVDHRRGRYHIRRLF